jgi:hypothetical protein
MCEGWITPTNTSEIDVSWMLGRAIAEVEGNLPCPWIFRFGEGAEIRTDSVWRIVVGGHIVLSSEDHQQQYGLPAPVDAEARCRPLIVQVRIERAEVREETRDIVIVFESGARLEILPVSSGYESWEITAPGGTHTVAQGGGNLAVWKRPRAEREAGRILDQGDEG